MDKNLRDLVNEAADGLIRRNLTLGTAESCTGGLIGALCTELPGSSNWFGGGIIAYSNEIKRKLLGVPDSVLENHGAVSLESGRDMALGALSALGTDCALSITGVAGPDGGSPDKPVGTVIIGLAVPTALFGPDGLSGLENCLADTAWPVGVNCKPESMGGKRISGPAGISGPDSHCWLVAAHFFPGDREAIRLATAAQALRLLGRCVAK